MLADADQTGDLDTTRQRPGSRSPLDENNPTKSDVGLRLRPNNTITGTVYRDDNRDKDDRS